MAELIPEPPDRGLPAGDPYRWWPLFGGESGDAGETWAEVCAPLRVDDATGEERPRPRPVEELVRRSEVDQLVAQARREASVIPLGAHLKEPGGWCRTHSIQHSEVEWARIHDQLAEGGPSC